MESQKDTTDAYSHLKRLICAVPQEELVKILLVQPPVLFTQYAGYVVLDNSNKKALFYYLAEVEADPAFKPLIIWLNRGTGCSLFGVGALSKHALFQPRQSQLIWNNYGWNKEANMLYVETPARVGFSYSTDEAFYNGVNDHVTVEDNHVTVEDNLRFLRGWLKKFPEYKTRDPYLVRESYAGYYIPQRANVTVSANKQEKIFNLNPLLEFFSDINSRGKFFWSHALISNAAYEAMENVCNYSRFMDPIYRNVLDPNCTSVQDKESKEFAQNQRAIE